MHMHVGICSPFNVLPEKQAPEIRYASRVEQDLQLLRLAVTHEWESLDQVLREHGSRDLGHPHVAGTALWHLRHMLEIFRIHCAAVTLGEVPCDGDVPQDPQAVRDLLLKHIDDFIAWMLAQPPRRLSKQVFYGRQVSVDEMIGIMTRHITWHSAAVHYWVIWKADAPPSPPAPSADT